MGFYRKQDDHYEVRIDQGRMALLGVGAGLVLALVFLVGVVVGKTLWEPRAPLAAQHAVAQPAAQPEARAKAEPKYTFYDDVRNADATGGRKVSRPTAIQPRTPAERAAPDPERTASKASRPAPLAKPPAAAAQAKPNRRLPTSVFTVQVGSFKDRNAALRLKKKLSGKGIDAEIIAARVDTQEWYRLQVGSFSSRSKAEAHYRNQLASKGVKGFVLAR